MTYIVKKNANYTGLRFGTQMQRPHLNNPAKKVGTSGGKKVGNGQLLTSNIYLICK